jgi:hypothetical protein
MKLEAREKILQSILQYLFPSKQKFSGVTKRAYAFCWLIRPSWLGSNPTQDKIAKSIGCSKAAFNKYVTAARAHWEGLICNGLRSDESRAKHAQFARDNAGVLADARRAAIKRKRENNNGELEGN